MNKGYLSFLLHAHLPFVRHPEHEIFLEERWLFEAITETYVPLLNVFLNLMKDGVPFKITMTLSPSLCNMLSDELLQARYLRHLDDLVLLAEKEKERTIREDPGFRELSEMYWKMFVETRRLFADRYQGNLLRGFREVMEAGHLEIITCGATHGFLPNMRHHPEAIRGQLLTAVFDYERHFGRFPKGIWLPECGYFPGMEKHLADAGLSYFIVDTHGVEFASPRPLYGVFAPIITPAGVAAFARDKESSKQVWSANEGYPGDTDYREYYRDIGFDLPFEYIRDHIHPDGIRLNTGIKYFRITGKGDLGTRQLYNRHAAMEKAAQHAANFMFNREKQIEWLYGQLGRKPIILAPYDAELFGHWWFEGPQWLEFLIRKIAYDQNIYELTTPSHYLEMESIQQIAVPSASSWGNKGYYEVWLNGMNDWIYPHLHAAQERMTELAHHPNRNDPLVERAVKQAARELLLAQASDWAFIITTQTAVQYAIQRTQTHLNNFQGLYRQITSGDIQLETLTLMESRNNCFPDINPDCFQRVT